MPSQDLPVDRTLDKVIDKYTFAPVVIFNIQSFLRLNAIESMVLNHLIISSINVYKVNSPKARQWVVISPSEFGNDRGFSRQAVHLSLRKLVEIGLFEVRDIVVSTNSGAQVGREYRLVSNTKLYELYDLVSSTARPRGVKSDLSPSFSLNGEGDKPRFTPCQATLVTLSGHALHLVRPYLSPWGVNVPLSLGKFFPKDSLNTIKYFLKTISSFENSFYELYITEANSKAAKSRIEMQICALIRRYGLFSTFTGMMVSLFTKNAHIGNFEVLEAFLKTNTEKLIIQEKELAIQCEILFEKLSSIHLNTEISELKIFIENFRQNVAVLFISARLPENVNELFIYDEIQNDVLYIFETSNHRVETFKKELLKKLNLYYKAKLLGVKGLNFVQSLDH